MFKTKIISLLLIPTAGAYSIAAGFFYRGAAQPLLDLHALGGTAVLSLAQVATVALS